MKRRELLFGTAALGATVALGSWRLRAGPPAARTLVMVELKGGNDGLNMLAPLNDPLYRKARPALALASKDALVVQDGVWLHPAARPIEAALSAGELCAVLNVGYAQPNRSHFRSIEIWDQASAADELKDEGWVTRALTAAGRDASGLAGVLFHSDPGPLAGARTLGIDDDDALERLAQRAPPALTPGPLSSAALHIAAVRADVHKEAALLWQKLEKVKVPADALAAVDKKQRNAVELVARLLLADLSVPALKITLPGFDTHRDQAKTHDRLLGSLFSALAGLRSVLMQAGAWDRALVMVTSEFGRRVKENDNGGTDHGAACPVLLFGKDVRGGVHGRYALHDLQDGDLKAAVEHRDVFGAVARKLWGDAAAAALAPAQRLNLFSA